VLLHADFSPDHIICNEEKNVIAGIIDFGDIEIGDPDYDLMYLYEDYWGEEFIGELLKYYPHRDTERLMRKLEFFSRCNTIHDVLRGIRRKDDGILQEALEELRKAT
jgi:aminoglycoside 2''-phosphotransferase